MWGGRRRFEKPARGIAVADYRAVSSRCQVLWMSGKRIRLEAGSLAMPAPLSAASRTEGGFSGDDVRRDLIFDEGDAVAQLQLALLQPLQAQQIRRRRLVQGIDGRVEIAVLLL